jgi:hypothetical protein
MTHNPQLTLTTMFKKLVIVIILVVIIAAGAIYFYRHAIIRHYTEKIIRENLPPYIKIESVNFDFTNNKISLKNFSILNPPEFSSQFLIKINEISCRYSMLGKGIPMGIEISDVLLNGADIRIERLKDGRVNAAGMEHFIQSFPTKDSRLTTPNSQLTTHNPKPLNKGLSDLIKLPTSFDIRNSKLVFIDRIPYENPYIITIQPISGQVSLSFSNNYSKITNLSFTLTGRLNGYEKESIQWVGSLDPTAPKITMSNRFYVTGLNILTFEPYYDKSSPFTFKKGRFSGTLVFDFNNGSIGSTNEIHLSNLAFSVKPGYENAQMWETNVQDLMQYFTTTSGEIVFDFKLKGDMANPQFYLGPISKRALTSMALSKATSYALDQISGQKQDANKQIDKAKEAIDMVRELLKNK